MSIESVVNEKKQSKFINGQREILNKLKSIDYTNPDTIKTLSYASFNLSKPLSSLEQTPLTSIENISSIYSQDYIKKVLNISLNSDIKKLSTFLDTHINYVSQIVSNGKHIECEYKNILNEINGREIDINEVIDNYSNFLTKNKTLLIRNEILQTFVSKINITKEEKDNLINQTLFDDKFFKLINKMTEIKNEIKVIERNSENFSKNLLFSIKENYNIVDELLNEKIVIYLKNLFRSNIGKKINFSKEQYSNIITTLWYLTEKENYLNFILKEYTSMRKKNLEEQLRNKYLKISKIEDIFKFLIEDFEFYFLKEFLTLFALFNNSSEIFKQDEQDQILSFLNNNSIENNLISKSDLISNCVYLISKIKTYKVTSRKDFNFYINYLNQMLYILEELFYENINYYKNQNNTENNFAEMYKITILAYFYYAKIETVLKSNQFSLNVINESLNLFSMLNNYKKSFSQILSKMSNDTFKNLQKIQKIIINGIKEENTINANNENVINKTIIKLSEEYSKCFSYFYQFGLSLNIKDKENLNPNTHSSFKLLIDFFNTENVSNELNVTTLLKILNLIQINLSKFEKKEFSNLIEEEINNLIKTYDKFEDIIVKNLTTNILKSTKFEDNLKKNISHEQTVNLIEHIMEKSQFYFLNLNIFSDFSAKENVKEKVKKEILQVYKEILIKEENLNLSLSFFSEEEFKNYLDIL